MLGEVEAAQQEFESARGYFKQALSVDTDSKKAQAGIELCNSVEDFVAHNARYDVGNNFASMCNTVGISLIRSKKMAEGIAQYQSALNFLGTGFTGGRVAFNLGLGYMKWSKFEESQKWFSKAREMIPNGFPKLDDYIERVTRAIEAQAGEIVDISGMDETVATDADDFLELGPNATVSDQEEDRWFLEENLIAS